MMDEFHKAVVEEPLDAGAARAKESLLASIQNDRHIQEELKRLGIGAEEILFYLSTLAEYQENYGACANCHGLEECKSASRSYQMVLEISDAGKLSYHYEECPFAKEKRRLMENYRWHDFSTEWFSLTAKSMRDLKSRKIRRLIMSALQNHMGKNWVYLYGEEESGKSHTLVALCNDFARAGKTISFLNCNQEFDVLKGLAINNRDQFERTLEEILSSDFLILDGFGDEFKSDYVRDQIVMPLLSERAKRGTPVFFSSNYSLEEIEVLYQTSKASNVIAKRLVKIIRNKLAIQEGLNPAGEFQVEKGLENLIQRKG